MSIVVCLAHIALGCPFLPCPTLPCPCYNVKEQTNADCQVQHLNQLHLYNTFWLSKRNAVLTLCMPCRLAKSVSISAGPLQVGSPGFLPEQPSFGNHYFIAALVPLTLGPPEQEGSAGANQGGAQLIPTHVGPRYATPGKRFSSLPSTGPFEGLLLGVLLGKGSFGRVYRGLWKGQLVGVKVRSRLCCM